MRKILILLCIPLLLCGCGIKSKLVGNHYYSITNDDLVHIYFINKKEVKVEAINKIDYGGVDVNLKYKTKDNQVIITQTNGSTMTFLYDDISNCLIYNAKEKLCNK